MSDPGEVGRKWMSPQGERAVVDQGMRGSEEYVAITTADSTMAALLPLKELEGEIRRDESNVAFRAATAKRKQEEVERLADLESLDGFEETLTPAARARAVKALTHKAIQHSGVFYKSSRDLIRALVAAGYEVAGRGSDRRLVSPDGSFFIQKDITKFGMDYAEFLATRAQRNPDDPGEDEKGTQMTDGEVLDAVSKIQRAYKSARTKAQRKLYKEKSEISAFFRGSSDVEQAARENAALRAERDAAAAIDKALAKRSNAFAKLRARAGGWADLVPATGAWPEKNPAEFRDPDEDVDTNWTKIALVALGGIALWFLIRRR